jgi:hypothetical protein
MVGTLSFFVAEEEKRCLNVTDTDMAADGNKLVYKYSHSIIIMFTTLSRRSLV